MAVGEVDGGDNANLELFQSEHVLEHDQLVVFCWVWRRVYDADIVVVPVGQTGVHLLQLLDGGGAVMLGTTVFDRVDRDFLLLGCFVTEAKVGKFYAHAAIATCVEIGTVEHLDGEADRLWLEVNCHGGS